MTLEELKEVNKMFFAVKGQLFPTQYTTDEMRSVYDSYFKRLWGNNERNEYIRDEFEQVWETRTTWLTGVEEEDLSKVANLGYD